MKTLIRSTLLSAALLGACSAIADEAVKAVPGAVMYAYSNNDTWRPDPEADPITVVVDKCETFSYENLKKNEDSRNLYGQRLFIVWKGYIHIGEPGKYTFSASNIQDYSDGQHIIIQLNGKDLLSINNGRWNNLGAKLNDSRSVALVSGDYELTVIFKAWGGNVPGFTLKMWNKNKPFKKTIIGPAKMVHAE